MAEFKVGKSGETEAQFRQFLAQLFTQGGFMKARTGVIGATGLGVSQTTTASASVVVDSGMGVVQDTSLNGAVPLINNSPKTLDVLVANPVGGVPRNDIVVFDASSESISVVVGDANATPTDPTVPATAIPLARLRHAAGATTVPASAIDSLRVYTATRGGITPANTQADRDVLFARPGTAVFRQDTKRLEVYNGASWDTYYPRGASGVVNIGQVAANSFAQWTVNFPAGMFAMAPRVVPVPSTARLSMAARNVTASSCTIEAYNASTVATSTTGEFFTWVAEQAS